MNSRRSHLQRTAKDAAYASELAAKETGRTKRKAGTSTCLSSKDSPKNKRKYWREQKHPTPVNAIEKIQVPSIPLTNNRGATYIRDNTEIQKNSYHSYSTPDHNDSHEKSTISSSPKETSKENQEAEDVNTTSSPKLNILLEGEKPDSSNSVHNGMVFICDNFNLSCDKIVQFKNETDTAVSNTEKSTTKIFTPGLESIVFVNQCDDDQKHIEDENNRAVESGELQVTIVKPHSFKVLGELQSPSASNMVDDILTREKKYTTHHQQLTPIFMTQRLNFEYGLQCDDSNDGGSTAKQHSHTSSTSQFADGENCWNASHHFLDNSKSSTPDAHVRKPCSNRILLGFSTLQTPKSPSSPTKAFLRPFPLLRSIDCHDSSDSQFCSVNCRKIFSPNIGNKSNASNESFIKEGRNGNADRSTLRNLKKNSPVLHDQPHTGLTPACSSSLSSLAPHRSETVLIAKQDKRERDMFLRKLEMAEDKVTGELPSLPGASDASRKQSSYSAIESGFSMFWGIPTFVTAGKGLAVQVTEHGLTFAKNLLTDTDYKEVSQNSKKTKNVQQLTSNKLSNPSSQDVSSGGLVGLSDEEGKIVGLQIGDVALSVSPPISTDLTITHDSKTLVGKNGSENSSSATDGSIVFSNPPVFITAGKRNVVQVGENFLFEAGNFLNSSSTTSHGSDPSLSFNSLQQDALCTQSDLLVKELSSRSGENSYRRADILNKFSSERGHVMCDKFSFTHTSEVATHNCLPVASSSIPSSCFCGSDIPTFSTVGRGHAIQVSEHSSIEANNFLGGLSSKRAVSNPIISGRLRKDMPTMVRTPRIRSSVTGASGAGYDGSKVKNYQLCHGSGVNYSHAIDHDYAQAGTSSSLSGNGKLGLPKFSTAGKSNVIQVSAHSLIEASKLLSNSASNEAPSAEERVNALHTSRFRGASNNAIAAVSEDSKKKFAGLLWGVADSCTFIKGSTQTGASKVLDIRKQPGSFPAFSTAGMGHVIQVSEQCLIEAGKFLNDVVPQETASNSWSTPRLQSSLTGSNVPVTEDSKKRNDVPVRDDTISCDKPIHEDVLKIDTSTNSNFDVACIRQPGASCAFTECRISPVFSTAGTGQVIEVSEQSLVAARNFLIDSASSRSSLNIGKPLRNTSWDGLCTPRFQRSGATVAVAEVCGKNAALLLRDAAVSADPLIINEHRNLREFSTVGTGHRIQVSEQSLVASKTSPTNSVPRRAASSSNIGKHLHNVSTDVLFTPRFQRSEATVAVTDDCRRNTDLLICDPAVSIDSLTITHGPKIDTAKGCISDVTQVDCSHQPGALSAKSVSSSSHASASGAATVTEDFKSKDNQTLNDVVKDFPQLGTCNEQHSSTNLRSLPVFVTAGKQNVVEADSYSLVLADRFLNGSSYQSESCDIAPNVNSCDLLVSRVPTHVLNKDAALTSGKDHLQELLQENSQPLVRKIASVTPGPYKFENILGAFSGKAASPRSLSKAAGILGHSPTPISITSVPQVLDYKLQVKSNERRWSKFLQHLPLNLSKLSLRELDVIQGNPRFRSIDNLLELGISRLLINVNSNTAPLLVFSSDGTPSYFYESSRKDLSECWEIAFEGSSAKEMYLNLIQQGVSEDVITKRWVANHYRWVVWSSAAMERRFPQLLCGRFCTRKKVMDKLKKRCKKELLNGYRPALRKILNRDAAASSLMILCISNIFVKEENDTSVKFGNETDVTMTRQQIESSSVRVELTDGWYSILAMFDSNLSKRVTSGQISVGSKLAFCGAILDGAVDGIDPLDSDYNPQSPHCRVFLRLFSNSTRRAKWDAKLGFCNVPLAVIPTTAFSKIYPDGGPISVVELVLCKIYPILYFENSSKRILTESQESLANRKFERDYEVAMESIIEDREKQLTMITETDAPDIWNSDYPCFNSSTSSETDRLMKDLWMNQGRDLFPRFCKKSINDALVDVVIRKSTPFVRALVKILRRNQAETGCYSSNSNSSALLTVWEPSDDWISVLKEGTAVRLRNVKCKPSQIDGKIQLSANRNTSIEPIPTPSDSVLRFSGFEGRFYCTMVSLHLLSKLQRFQYEFDVVGFRIPTRSETNTNILRSAYFTDESGLLLRIDRYFDSENCSSPPWNVSKCGTESSSLYSFLNLRLIDFSVDQKCAIALWTESSVVETRSNGRSLELLKFSQTNEGENVLSRAFESLSTTIAVIGKGPDNLCVAIGIVISVNKTYGDEEQFNRSQYANIVIDCGSDALLRATICLKRLEGATGLLFEDDTIPLNSSKLRNTGRYFSFVLKKVHSHLHQGFSTEMNVEAMLKVDASLVSSSYNL